MGRFVHENTKAYDVIAPDWDDQVLGSPFYLNQRRLSFQLMDRYVKLAKPGQTALDLGCGTGNHTIRLLEQGYAVTSLDISEEMLRATKSKTLKFKDRLRVVKADAEDLDDLPGSYDYVICFGSVFNHIEDWPKLFKNLRRLMKPGGLLLFDVDNVCGLDYILLAIYSRIFKWSYRPTSNDVAECLSAIRNGTSITNHWPLATDNAGQSIDIRLIYWPFKTLLGMLNEAEFEPISVQGTNMLACLFPRIVHSGVQSSTKPVRGPARLLYNWAFRLDSWLCKRFYPPAGVHFLVCRTA